MRRQQEAAVPEGQLVHQMRQHFKVKDCMSPFAGDDCGKTIGAHTIQRRGPLEQVVDSSNHVYTFFPLDFEKDGTPKLKRRGWKDASTFLGFCDVHDGPTFAPLETQPFTGSQEQCFLIGYRALCHELYQKRASSNSYALLRDNVDRGFPIEAQLDIQHQNSLMQAGVERAVIDASNSKARMDRALIGRDYSKWQGLVIHFSGPMSVTGTGAFSPMHDVEGNVVQVLHDFETDIEYMPFAIVNSENGGAFVFTWHRDDKAPISFRDSLVRMGQESLPSFLVQLVFEYCENTYFSRQWWDSLAEQQQAHIREVATNGNPYYFPDTFIKDRIIPWRVTEISHVNP